MFKYKYYIYALILIAGIILALSVNYLRDYSEDKSSTKVDSPISIDMENNNNGRGVVFGSLLARIPMGWKVEKPSSSMRIGQFRLSGSEFGEDDAELAVFSGIGGSIESNLNRWFNQFQQPDGSPSNEIAKTNSFSINDMRVTMADLSGRYIGSGMAMTQPLNRAGYRLLAAIVETSGDSYFFKLVGPQATIEKWAQSFNEFIMSIRHAGY